MNKTNDKTSQVLVLFEKADVLTLIESHADMNDIYRERDASRLHFTELTHIKSIAPPFSACSPS